MEYKKILVVDDSSTARMLTIITLKMLGFQTSIFYEADNGLEALALLEKKTPQLIITDIIMPRINGYSFIKKLRSLDRFTQTPIIIESSLAPNMLEDFILTKNFVVIQKPLDSEKMKKALDQLV